MSNTIDIDQFIKELDQFLREWNVILYPDIAHDYEEDIDGNMRCIAEVPSLVVENAYNSEDYWDFDVLPTDAE